jgi:predicted O-methyltransferase YrrM
MYNLLHRAISYVKYWFKAQNAHGLHSPFVFRVYTEVIATDTWFYAFEELEDQRQYLIKNQQVIQQLDFGAGGSGKEKQTTISLLARTSLLPPNYAQILFRLVNHLQPNHIVELGTSLGLTTAYLAMAHPSAKVATLEGAPALASFSAQFFVEKKLSQIQVITGHIDETLPQFLAQSAPIDFVLLDANHTFDATLRYVDWMLPKLSAGACLVVDDIYWSKGMTEAWQTLIVRSEFSTSIDLYRFGLLFYKRDQQKQHFILRT